MNYEFFKSRQLYWILLFIGIVIFGLFIKFKHDVASIKTTYIKEQTLNAEQEARKIESKIHIAYQTIRTTSFLPGILKLENYGDKADDNSKATVQQLYNNAFADVKLSEIYIISKNFNPDHIDPKTKKGEEPIEKFDTFIVGTPEAKAEENPAEKPGEKVEEKKDKLEEVEDFEYKLIRTQIDYFLTNFPKRANFKDIDAPMMMGPEVVTCDNSEFTKADFDKNNNAPRNGLVLSVPKYSPTGEFNGVVSTILRTKTILSYLPPKYFGLANTSYNDFLVDSPSKEWTDSAVNFKKSENNPNLIFSKKIKLNFHDVNPWELWVAMPDSHFYESVPYKSVLNIFILSLVGVIFLGGFGIFYFYKMKKNSLFMVKIIQDLSDSSAVITDYAKSVHTSSDSLTESSKEQARATEGITVAVEQISAMAQQSNENVTTLVTIFQQSSNSSAATKLAVEKLSEALEVINKNEQMIMEQVEENNSKMQDVISFINEISMKTKIIDDIVFQTKLLSFNASVEAARAGEQGKGFAVVAEEVGKLAQSSGLAAKEINNLLHEGIDGIKKIADESNQKIKVLVARGTESLKNGERFSKESSEQLSKLADLSLQVQLKINEISAAIAEQNSSLGEIEKSTNLFSTTINESVSVSTKNSTIASDMLDQSISMTDSLLQFKKIV